MKVFIAGASGFIGSAIQKVFSRNGHRVVRGVRQPQLADDVSIDFLRDTHTQTWVSRLEGMDAVINAVGVLGGTELQMDTLHARVPSVLVQACSQLGIKHFVHISALGVDQNATTRYFRSKYRGEQVIRSILPAAHILRPSIVYGKAGSSSMMFRQLTRLPILMLPKAGEILIQPVHVNDLAEVAYRVMARDTAQTLPVLGPTPMSLAAYLSSLAEQLQRRPPVITTLPLFLARCSAAVLQYLPQHVWTPETLEMLLLGNTGTQAEVEQLQSLLARPLIAVEAFVNTLE